MPDVKDATNATTVMEKLDCQICGQEESVGVASSPLGPVSWAYGKRCLEEGAEKLVMFEGMFDRSGDDLKKVIRDGALASWAHDIKIFEHGQYVTIMQWATLPRIYVFENTRGPVGTDYMGYAIAEDGTWVGQHVSSSEAFLIHDLGANGKSNWHHPEYRKHSPEGFIVEYVPRDQRDEHVGLQAALARSV